MVHNGKFSATNHRGVLLPKVDGINLKYCKFILEPLFRQTKKGRIGIDGSNEYTALPPFMTENIEFSMPIDENGDFDIFAQEELVEKYEFVSDVKLKISEYQRKINDLRVEITDATVEMASLCINDLFDLRRGRVISKQELNKNPGVYPVYSSNTKENGVLGYLKSYDFDCEGITWTTDGIYAGTTFYRSGKFSITNVCGLITVKDIYKGTIYLPYIRDILNFKNIATGTANKKVMTNVILSSNITVKSLSHKQTDLT